jgi:hypothetical protein
MNMETLEEKFKARDKYREEHKFYAFCENVWDFFRYTIPRFFDENYYKCKYGFQRMFRGYDDPMIFEYKTNHTEMIIKILKWYRHHRMGSPCPDDSWDKGKEEFTIDIHEAYNKQLDKMIAGFEATLAQDSLFIETDGKYDSEKTTAEYNRLEKIWQEGAALYIKYYGNLWD